MIACPFSCSRLNGRLWKQRDPAVHIIATAFVVVDQSCDWDIELENALQDPDKSEKAHRTGSAGLWSLCDLVHRLIEVLHNGKYALRGTSCTTV